MEALLLRATLDALVMLSILLGVLSISGLFLWWNIGTRRDWIYAKRLRETMQPLGLIEQTTRIGQSICATGRLDRFEARVDLDLAQDGRNILSVHIALASVYGEQLHLSARPFEQRAKHLNSRGLGDAQFDERFDCLAGHAEAIAQLTPLAREGLIALAARSQALSDSARVVIQGGELFIELGWHHEQWPQQERAMDELFDDLLMWLSTLERQAHMRLAALHLEQLNTPQPLEWRAQALRHLLHEPSPERDQALTRILLDPSSAPRLRELCDLYALELLEWGVWPHHDRALWHEVIMASVMRQNDLDALTKLAGFLMAQSGPSAILSLDLQHPTGRRMLRGALRHTKWRAKLLEASSQRLSSLPWTLQRIFLQEMTLAQARIDLDVLRLMLTRALSNRSSLRVHEDHLQELIEALMLWPAAVIEADLIALLKYPSSRHQAHIALWMVKHGSALALPALQQTLMMTTHGQVARSARQAITQICERLGLRLEGSLSMSYPDDAQGQLSISAELGQLKSCDSGEFVMLSQPGAPQPLDEHEHHTDEHDTRRLSARISARSKDPSP